MAPLLEMQLSLITLLVTFILPFSYYGYQSRFWYDSARRNLFDFALQMICLVVAILLAARLYYSAMDRDTEQLHFVLVHFAVIVLTFMAIARGKKLGVGGASPEALREGEAEAFKPDSQNQDIDVVAWEDLIIADTTKQELLSIINLLKNPQTAKDYGIALPKGILFNGPPGTGKTTIAKAVASMAGLNFFVLRANDIVSKWVGESEKNLTKLFDAARKKAPSVIFIDEIDSLGKKRSDNNPSHADNLLNHLLQLIDGVIKVDGLYVIAATNRADLVDDALRRAGRLNRVVEIPLPDIEARKKLFGVYARKLRLAPDIDLDILARVTDGNSGADIKAICDQAGLIAFQREQMLPAPQRTRLVLSKDIESALSLFEVQEDFDSDTEGSVISSPQPLNGRVEKLSWDDLIIDDELKSELRGVIGLLRDPATAERYGIKVPKGILLNGPPGTGKTTLAKVIANEAQLTFFALQANEVISKWVGESEKNLTRLFQAAAKHAPSVIFIDEIDAIAKNRAEGNAQHADNLLNHLLQLIDGVISREGVYIIGATNRADLVDPALKRGGRLNKVIEVPLPTEEARIALFSMYMAKLPLAESVDINRLAKATQGKCAADIREICNQAGLNAFKRESARGSREYTVTVDDLEKAVKEWVKTPEVQ